MAVVSFASIAHRMTVRRINLERCPKTRLLAPSLFNIVEVPPHQPPARPRRQGLQQ